MSTPTTAAAAAPLPHYNHHSHHHHHHHHHNRFAYPHQYPSSGPSGYRTLAPANIIPPIAPYSAQPTTLPQLSGYAISTQPVSSPVLSGSGHADTLHGPVTDIAAPASRQKGPAPAAPVSASASVLHASAALALSRQQAAAAAPRVKRRRSKGPDWGEFYKNGLPTEVIVIEDTPEPEIVSVKPASSYTTNGATTARGGGRGGVTQSSPGNNSAKKRKRDADADATTYDPVHGLRPRPSHGNTPRRWQIDPSNPSAIPNDGTTIYKVPTLSQSSAVHDEANSAPKRKRIRRVASDDRKDGEPLEGFLAQPYRSPELPPKKAAEVAVRIVREPRAQKHVKVDEEDGHYVVIPESDLTDNYKIDKVLGQGTFGKVVRAKDRRRNKLVAIKIIRSVQKYREASRIELRVLQTLKLNDPDNRNRCIHLRDCFDFRGHICIVMDLLGQSVFDFLKSTHFVPFPNSHIQSFAQQLLTSVAYLHDINLIHTDLKPENILLCEDSYQTFTYNRKIPSSSLVIGRVATQRRVLLNPEIRLIDFGSATFQDEYHSSVVSTRHYRAPEIILGLGWSYPCDIWSIGCILVEFFTGDALFQTHDNLEHLAMMEAVVGSKVDHHLVREVNRTASARSSGNPAHKFFKRMELDYPNKDSCRKSRKFVKSMKRLGDIIPSNTEFQRLFLDLLVQIFVYDPAKRITAKQALQHPWFTQVPIPDDGTEAARIRQHRMNMATHALID